jgi:putative hemolysin
MMIILISILVFLIILSAYLSASETALFSLSSYTIRSFKNSDEKRKRLVYKLMQKPRDLLVTIIMLNVFANILVQNTVSSLFGNFSSWLLKVGLPLLLTLLFGEIIPKSVAMPNNVKISTHVSCIINLFAKIFGPIRFVLSYITSYISRVLFFFLKKEKPISLDELDHILKESSKSGVLDVEESDLIRGYIDLHETSAKENMRPREEILFYDINDPISKLIDIFVKEKCTRLPVCDDDLQNMLGIISAKKFFLLKDEIKSSKELLKKYVEKPFFIPESTKCWNLFSLMKAKNEQIAIVVDEYGAIKGLVSQEDFIESVVGEIKDLRDVKSLYTRSSEDVIIASGKLELDEFEDIFGIDLQTTTNPVTIGGYLIEKLNDIPKIGTKFETNDFLFCVLAADPHRIRRVYIRRLKKR